MGISLLLLASPVKPVTPPHGHIRRDGLVLGVGPEAHRAVLPADTAGLEAAERAAEGHRGAVDRDGAGADAAGDRKGMGLVGRPDATGEAVFGVVGDADGLVLVAVGDDDRTGPKISSRAMRIELPTSAKTVGVT